MRTWLWLPLLLSLGFAGCGKSPAGPPAAGKLKVFVTVPPLAYFANRLGGGRLEVHTLVPPGQDPHTYTVPPREIAALAQARIYFRVGIPVEDTLLPKIQSANPRLQVVDTRQGIELRKLEANEEAVPAASPVESDSELDPHIWMSPVLAEKQAATMCAALIKIDPAGKPVYEKNYAALAADLDKLDARLKKILAPVKGKELFVFHPAYGYFARQYGLRQVAVETGGKSPSARQLSALIALAKARGVRLIFVQPQFSPKRSQAIAAAIDGGVLPLDDLAEDYLANLETGADKVAAALARQK
jgi:zinc transport system substrate-binding protein